VVGLVVVSHSAKLAEGVAELALSLQPDLRIRAAGGTDDGRLGTSADRILQAILEVDGPEGVLILVDLGSAVMSAEIALEWLTDEQRTRVLISDAPLVEGALIVATSAELGLSLAELATAAQEARHFPKNVGPVATGAG
jgi:phosphoenolpyruvate---glycerone phosphotransferase subunit DhaM